MTIRSYGPVIELVAGDELRDKGDEAEQTRKVVLAAVARAKKLTVAEAREGRNIQTDEAVFAALTVTMSLRQAYSLLRVLGPIGLQNGDGSYTRLFAAMHIAQRQLMRAPAGKNLGVVAALQVLQVAINDHLWACRDVPGPGFGGDQPGLGRVKPRRGRAERKPG